MTAAKGPARQLRSLNQPRPVQVLTDENKRPVSLLFKGRRRSVDFIKEQWRIDDEWWRRFISRRYFRIVLNTGVLVSLYHDLVEDRWYRQDA